jgi:hypothetical protein
MAQQGAKRGSGIKTHPRIYYETPMMKKSRDVAKVWCFNYKELGHFTKDYEKVRQD